MIYIFENSVNKGFGASFGELRLISIAVLSSLCLTLLQYEWMMGG